MIVHNPETRQENGQYIVSARIEYKRDHNLPNELWYSVDEELSPHTSTRADIFLSSLIRVARAIGEDIEVRGELSPQLMFGMHEYLKVHAAWSGNYDIITINASNLVPEERATQGVASCNISGGVDSFHTLWSHLPENEPAHELLVKYGIFGIGLSSPYHNDFLKTNYVPRLKGMLKPLEVNLLVVETNISAFALHDPWLPISTSRIAIPQLFSGLISTHFVPSSDMYLHLKPLGSHPMTNHLFSTEGVRILTQGSEYFRSEKLVQLKDWDLLYGLLQVCNYPITNSINDCRCKKCLRSMLALEVFGVKQKFTSFHLPLKRRKLIGRIVRSDNMYADFKFLARYAWTQGRRKLLPFILTPMIIYKLTRWIKPLLGYKFE